MIKQAIPRLKTIRWKRRVAGEKINQCRLCIAGVAQTQCFMTTDGFIHPTLGVVQYAGDCGIIFANMALLAHWRQKTKSSRGLAVGPKVKTTISVTQHNCPPIVGLHTPLFPSVYSSSATPWYWYFFQVVCAGWEGNHPPCRSCIVGGTNWTTGVFYKGFYITDSLVIYKITRI